MSLYISIGLVVLLLVIGFIVWVAGLINNLRDSYTPLSDREIIAKGAGVNTRSAKAPEDCQHVQDFEQLKALYRGDRTVHITPNDSAFHNKRAQVEARIAAGRHKDDWGGDS